MARYFLIHDGLLYGGKNRKLYVYIYTYNIYVMPTMPTTNGCVYMRFNHSGIIPDHFKCPDCLDSHSGVTKFLIQSTTKVNGTSDIGATGITSPCQISIKERATKHTPLKVHMMEHSH